jgi:photosystem II stability/assembly factor-like uncharacterized protein
VAHDVFISHSAKDKVIADAVCAALESEGIRCWIAPRDVMPGMEWGGSIIDAIENARIMVLIFTANSNASPQIRREIERAANHEVVILPFRIEDILPDKSLEYFIGNVHWLDALTPPLEKHIERLVEPVKALLAQVNSRPRQSAPQPTAQSGRPMPAAPDLAAPAPASIAAPAVSEPIPGVPGIPAQGPPAKARKPSAWRVVLFTALGLAVLVCASFGVYFALRPRMAGVRWVPRNSGTTHDIASIFAAGDGKHLWAVGGYKVSDAGFLGTYSGMILESDDGGATWMVRNGDTSQFLSSIFGTSDGKHLWAVGQHGTILASDDGGATWAERSSGTTNDLNSIFGTSDGQRLWIAGGGVLGGPGTILASNDGGAIWATINSGTTNGLDSIFGSSDGKRLWAVGWGAILESEDEGATWTARNGATGKILDSVFETGDGEQLWAFGVDLPAGSSSLSPTNLESKDGGATWTAREIGTSNQIRAIFGTSDGKHLWAVGDKGTILQSNDGGANWTLRGSGATNNLFSICGTADGRHLWVAGEKGVILESDSGGHGIF